MIITRAPLRISFSGGGTDIPEFYLNYGPGIVVSTAIDRYVYVTLNEKFDGKVSVRYSQHENVESVRELKHALIREALLHYGIEKGIEIVVASEVPARGSGLGASSSMMTALCVALEMWKAGYNFKSILDLAVRKTIAEEAAFIEIEKCGSPIGKQDHYAAAIGGLNRFEFKTDGSVFVEGFEGSDFIREIESQSMLFYLNIGHEYKRKKSSGPSMEILTMGWILKDQKAQIHEKRRVHELQRDNARELWEHMKYEVPERFIDHINENWRIKRTVHEKISNFKIEDAIQRAYAAGAVAAKICGQGGGGFIYLVVPKMMQDKVRESLREFNELRFGFSENGVEIIFDGRRKNFASVSSQ